jgi:SAM-dependent methyltransferase
MKFHLSSGFSDYYDRNWLKTHDYFRVHRERFFLSWSFIEGIDLRNKRVLEPGVGPLGSYIRDSQGAEVFECNSDLREDLPFADQQFDFIICTEVIEHIKDRDSKNIADLESFNYSGVLKMLSEFRRILRQNGLLFITTPNTNSLITLMKWVYKATLLMDPGHVREFSLDDLVNRCSQTGLIPKKLETIDTWDNLLGKQVEPLRKLLEGSRIVDMTNRGQNIFALFGPNAA